MSRVPVADELDVRSEGLEVDAGAEQAGFECVPQRPLDSRIVVRVADAARHVVGCERDAGAEGARQPIAGCAFLRLPDLLRSRFHRRRLLRSRFSLREFAGSWNAGIRLLAL